MSILTLSCGSDDGNTIALDTSNTSSQNVILPVKMSLQGESVKINYDGTKILDMISPNNPGNKIIFTYVGDFVSSIKFYENNILESSTDYTYANNVMTKSTITEYSNTGTVQNFVSYLYTHVNSNQINVKRQYIHGSSTDYTINSVYNYSGGNLLSSTGSGSGISNGIATTYNQTFSYSYTDKSYPFKNVKGFDKIIYNGDMSDGVTYMFSNLKNNIDSYKEASTHNSNLGTGTSLYGYKITATYNSNGYPIYESRQQTDINGVPNSSQPEIYTYEYNQ